MTKKLKYPRGSGYVKELRCVIGIDYINYYFGKAKKELVGFSHTRKQIEGDVEKGIASIMRLESVDGPIRTYVVGSTAYVYREHAEPNPLGLMELIDLKRM